MQADTLEKFMRLYRGRTDAYGVGRGGWVHKPPSSVAFMDHLEGRGSGIGIAPLLDDGTCWWAAVDLDEPNFEAAADMQKLLGFATTWVERSRSGNAHVLCFFAEPVESWVVRGILRDTTLAIGKPTTELFPKQDRLLEGMVGNYLNCAYHGSSRPILWHGTQAPYPIDQFLTLALDKLNDPAAWRKRADWMSIAPPEQRLNEQTEFGTGKELHKCCEWIIANRDEVPISEGYRNVVYFNLCKMLLHYEGFDDEEAWDLILLVRDSANEQGVDDVQDAELRRIFNNVKRGGFVSTGCDDPLMSPFVHPDCPIAKGH
jgi:hypothetical protein